MEGPMHLQELGQAGNCELDIIVQARLCTFMKRRVHIKSEQATTCAYQAKILRQWACMTHKTSQAYECDSVNSSGTQYPCILFSLKAV